MAFVKFVRTKVTNKTDPIASLSKNHFHFHAVAARMAELEHKSHVIYHFDAESRKIGFEFRSDADDRSSYAIFSKVGTKSFRSTISDVCNRYPWVRAVALLDDPEDRKFLMKPEQRMWVIQLCPAFEHSEKSVSDVPTDANGIYRYLDAGDKIIYIGKGNVRRRYAEKGRSDWGISTIEYSIVSDDDAQFEWEHYWVEKYKEKHHGNLPPRNLVSGNSA